MKIKIANKLLAEDKKLEEKKLLRTLLILSANLNSPLFETLFEKYGTILNKSSENNKIQEVMRSLSQRIKEKREFRKSF